jgi:hypothetical protein
MARKTPTVWVALSGTVTLADLEIPDGTERPIRLESARWWIWLESATARSFAYPIYDQQAGYIRGFMTVRKERRARGGQYWVAYRRTAGVVRKIYLGRSADLTQRHLARSAERFFAMDTAAATRKEVMPGQCGDVSLEWEVMMRRVITRHQVVHLGRL